MSLAKSLTGGMRPKMNLRLDRKVGRVKFNLFFNRQTIKSRLTRKERKVLGKTGSFTRGVMRRGIRKAGKRYDPDKHTGPPRYHSRGFGSLKDGIFFQADLVRSSVVIGPNKLGTNVDPVGKRSSAQLLNEGGIGIMRSFRYRGANKPSRWTQRRGHWKKRSFTEPAFRPGTEKLRELIRTVEL